MTNTSRPRSRLLPITAAVIALAAVLLATALRLRDFGTAEEAVLSGRSTLLVLAAFGLLAGCAVVLLLLLLRSERPAARPERRTHPPQGPAAPEAKTESPAEILSETAGELRTTVESIQEELEEILEDEAPADKEHMQQLYDETDRLRKIIDSMEQLSRAQELAQSGAKETIALEPLLKGIIERTQQEVTGKEVAYTLQCEPGLSVRGNPECIGRIVGNIADNAARSIRGSGAVTLSARRDGDRVIVAVRDTGTGIRRAHLPHIYERFFRGTGAGIGMGLSIAKELTDACGGSIRVETAVNKGTTFTIELPAE